ncbi:carboxypeptidase-like regulatory domain-containing protein [Dyadobacter fanqingshengii]|uniref:Carboxypeptidase-like regulatory domain-containing protein n=1 Tax=Dyadobacter fanqingshengii TaxID=2906443 RepID=A0A9X1P9B2_9BACT|nr:carboxypeptidase-like regulatory domain-containing protein [Dyadobacter fanqingshengii]MCF0040064.1 carboxypeptidase-like regulatory domain-containing protein [Dyadobacter fanqingshengii]USJ38184.1 carboxypeptidase-like regulatory domain-containing protein [Dyadobacter fanqingshengii]
MPVGSAIQSCPYAEGKQEEQDPAKKWIEFYMQDANGSPVAGVTLVLKLSDGNVVEATSDETGIIHITNVPDGSCELLSNWKTFDVHSSVFIN